MLAPMLRGLFLAVLFASVPAMADDEMWRWIDEDGTPHYTNDKATIPAKYKARATTTTGGEIGVVNVKEGNALDTLLGAGKDRGGGNTEITQDDVEADNKAGAKVGAKVGAQAKFTNEVKQVLVFGAPWCQPCLMMKKQGTVEALIKAHPELRLREIDADQKPEVAKKYNVTALPTVVFTDGAGKELLRLRGPKTLEQFERALTVARGGQANGP
jgi:thiol-disulfide isomerase/thioredoxin